MVGKKTLDRSLEPFRRYFFPVAPPPIYNHRFGNHDGDHRTICAINFTFKSGRNDYRSPAKGDDVMVDVIPG